VNHPREKIQTLQPGEILKSRIKQVVASLCEWEMSVSKLAKFLQGFLAVKSHPAECNSNIFVLVVVVVMVLVVAVMKL